MFDVFTQFRPAEWVAIVTLLSFLGGGLKKIYGRIVASNRRIKEIQECQSEIFEIVQESRELSIELIKANLAALTGHIENGANGPVKEAKKQLQDYIIEKSIIP